MTVTITALRRRSSIRGLSALTWTTFFNIYTCLCIRLHYGASSGARSFSVLGGGGIGEAHCDASWKF
jgi:hypothetical protein